MNHTAILSSSTFFPLHLFLSLHLTPASLPLGIFLPCLLPFFFIISFFPLCVSVSPLPSKHTCPNLLPLLPPLSLHSKPTLTDEYQTTGPGSSRCPTDFKHFLHFLLPHSRYFVHLLFFFFFKPHPSMQLLSYEYKQPFKWQLQGVCLCVCLHELIHQHLRDPTNKQQLSDVSTALLSACDE